MKAFILSSLILLVVASVSNAQEIRPGILAGVNFQNLNGEDVDGDKLENDLIVGFHGGVNLLMPIAPEINFQPGVLFSTKGSEINSNVLVDLLNVSYRISYIEVPLNLVYRPQLGDNYILLGFGPYFAFAVGGKWKVGDNIEREFDFRNTIDADALPGIPYLRRFDAGANIFFGYELEAGLFVTLNAQLGLMNINPEDNRTAGEEGTLKNTGFGLSLGYRF